MFDRAHIRKEGFTFKGAFCVMQGVYDTEVGNEHALLLHKPNDEIQGEGAPDLGNQYAFSHDEAISGQRYNTAVSVVSNEDAAELPTFRLEPLKSGLPDVWKDAVAQLEKPPVLDEPWPFIEVRNDLKTPEEVEALLRESSEVQALLEKCRTPEYRREIAQQYIDKFKNPDAKHESLLLDNNEPVHYWVVGDVHASLTAIAKVWAWILYRKQQDDGRHVLIFLGDLLDRGKEDLETLAFVEYLLLNEDVFYITGNHDIALQCKDDGSYHSSVLPSETKDRLNASLNKGEHIQDEADAAMLLATISPRMVEIVGLDPDKPERTVMLVHGGVPHTDLQEKLYRAREEIRGCKKSDDFLAAVPEDFRSQVAEDYTWLRFSDNLPFKRANRSTRGCEIGTEDVNAYRRLHYLLTGRAITCILRGHDHERDGYRIYSYHEVYNNRQQRGIQRKTTVLTINTMEPSVGEGGLFRERKIAVAHLAKGESLKVYELPTRMAEPGGNMQSGSAGNTEPDEMQKTP